MVLSHWGSREWFHVQNPSITLPSFSLSMAVDGEAPVLESVDLPSLPLLQGLLWPVKTQFWYDVNYFVVFISMSFPFSNITIKMKLRLGNEESRMKLEPVSMEGAAHAQSCASRQTSVLKNLNLALTHRAIVTLMSESL